VTAFAPKQTGASGIVTVTIATTAGTSPPSPGARFSYSAAT
jgi:hypothetical protein